MLKSLLYSSLSLVLLGGTLFVGPQAQSAAGSARVTHVFGLVQARAGSGWQAAGLNQTLYPGMTLRTGSNSRSEIRYHDGSLVRLGSRTILRVRSAKDLRLLRGKTWIKKQHNPGERMRIRTPIAVATVIGTELFVSHNEHNVSHVTTLNGIVEVSSEQGETKQVKPGEWVEIEPGKPLQDPTKFDWNELKKKERFMIDLNFSPPPAVSDENLDEDWK